MMIKKMLAGIFVLLLAGCAEPPLTLSDDFETEPFSFSRLTILKGVRGGAQSRNPALLSRTYTIECIALNGQTPAQNADQTEAWAIENGSKLLDSLGWNPRSMRKERESFNRTTVPQYGCEFVTTSDETVSDDPRIVATWALVNDVLE